MRKILLAILLILLVALQVQARISRLPNQKPIHGSQVDWTHPLARDLKSCYLANEFSGSAIYNLIDNRKGNFINGVWTTKWSKNGVYLRDNGAGVNNDIIDFGSGHSSKGSDWTVLIVAQTDVSPPGENTLWTQKPAVNQSSTVLIRHDLSDGKWWIQVGDTGGHNWHNYTSFGLTTGVPFTIGFSMKWAENTMQAFYNGEVAPCVIGGVGFRDAGTYPDMEFLGASYGGWVNYYGWTGPVRAYFKWKRALTAKEMRQVYEDPYCFIKKPQNMALRWLGIPAAAPPAGGGGVPTQIIGPIVTQWISDEVYAGSLAYA